MLVELFGRARGELRQERRERRDKLSREWRDGIHASAAHPSDWRRSVNGWAVAVVMRSRGDRRLVASGGRLRWQRSGAGAYRRAALGLAASRRPWRVATGAGLESRVRVRATGWPLTRAKPEGAGWARARSAGVGS